MILLMYDAFNDLLRSAIGLASDKDDFDYKISLKNARLYLIGLRWFGMGLISQGQSVSPAS